MTTLRLSMAKGLTEGKGKKVGRGVEGSETSLSSKIGRRGRKEGSAASHLRDKKKQASQRSSLSQRKGEGRRGWGAFSSSPHGFLRQGLMKERKSSA